MKVLLLNDTSSYHSGCAQVINYLRSRVDIFASVSSSVPYVDRSLLEGVDILVINGEGTMHDDALRARDLISVAKEAKLVFGIKTFLVNSVWQRNDLLTEDLVYFDYISVREVLSKDEITRVIDIGVDISLDLSYYVDVPYKEFERSDILCGNYFRSGRLIRGVGGDGYIDIFGESWENIVNRLRHSNLLVTGRHHELYAACKARCPFIVLEGNTHKNSGLMETFGVNIPVLGMRASIEEIKFAISSYRDYLGEYEKLFNSMEGYEAPNFWERF